MSKAINYKFILIGNTGVGKTSIFRYLSTGEFFENNISSIGIDKKTLDFSIEVSENKKKVKKNFSISLFDTAGQEQFKSITFSYFKGSDGILLLYDITNRLSFDNIEMWVNDIRDAIDSKAQSRYAIILIGNKFDLVKENESNRKITEQVSLDICKDIPIKIYSPVNLKESQFSLISNLENSGYNAFDINDDFYNDICSTYTAENGADMVLSSRKSLIYDQNKEIYLCQSGCEFSSFNTKIGRAECNCKVQSSNTVTDISKISFDKTKFVDSFYKTLFNSNFRVLKCVKLLFSSKGFKKNIGFYLMSALLGLFFIFIVIYLLTGQKNMMDIINTALKAKGNEIDQDTLKESNKDKQKKSEKKKI